MSVATDTFKISLTSGGSAIAYTGETSLDLQGVTNGTYPIFYFNNSGTVSEQLRDTAQGLVKAINRDPSSLIYAQYSSGVDDVPGKIRLQAKGFTAAIYVRASGATPGAAFSPVLPASFSVGTQVYSRNSSLPHGFYASKVDEPEAVPLVNFFPAGAKSAQLLRCHALRDSIILLKEDGVWRVTGDNPSNFAITLLDGTVQCLASDSADVINNQVVFLSNQGICLVTENSVQIVSRKIEQVIQPILGQSTIAAVTSGLAYETERLYLMTTTEPNETAATQTYAYNLLTDAWTTWDDWLFEQAVIGPSDNMYYISANNEIMRERKKQTKIDYCGQNHSVTVDTVSTDLVSAYITCNTTSPLDGDIIVKDGVINIIDDILTLSATTFQVFFRRASNLAASDSVILYKAYESVIKIAPFHGGMVGRTKQFSQLQTHFRDNSCSRMTITFTGQTFGGSESVDWDASTLISQLGWGLQPWGIFPWGDQNGINLQQGSQAAPVCRIYIPRFQQRGTYIQAVLQNNTAGEPLNIQALAFTVRAYQERVTR